MAHEAQDQGTAPLAPTAAAEAAAISNGPLCDVNTSISVFKGIEYITIHDDNETP